MQVITPELVSGKKVLLRLDLDVPYKKMAGELIVADDFRLEAGMATLELCLEHAKSVVVLGHVGRPGGKEDPNLTVKPIVDWLEQGYGHIKLQEDKLHILENLRFEEGEDKADLNFAKELASYGDFFVNEAFASHHKSASTTVLPTLLPHAAGLNFAYEVEEIEKVMSNPVKPFVAIVGGVKIEDKLPAIEALAKIADHVLVGGKIAAEIKSDPKLLKKMGENVLVADLNGSNEDITPGTVDNWIKILSKAKTVLWNGPLGKYEDPANNQSEKIAEVLGSLEAETIVGGGDTITALDSWGLLDKFKFVSTGGGAMLELITKGTLETIEVLK